MIKVEGVCKSFGDFPAVKHLSFDVNAGDVVGFLGPNGAGKSTTMKMLTGYLTLDAGQIQINGLDIGRDITEIKHQFGYLPEGAPAYGEMTPAQFLDFIADIRMLKGNNKFARIKDVIAQLELHSVLHKPIETLSKGFKRRVGLAQAIIHDPQILILDEPTDGLDPNQKHQVRELILNLSKDKMVIISTHILEEVTAVCNRAIIINSGEKLYDGTPWALEEHSKYHNAVTIEFASKPPESAELKGIEGVKEVIMNEGIATLFPQGEEAIYPAVYQHATAQSWDVKGIYVEKGRLDDVFRTLTGHSSGE